MTTEVNKPITLGEDLFRDLVWDPLVEAGLTALKAQVPAFAVWPLSTLTDSTIKALSNFIFTQVRLLVDLTAIKLLNELHQSAYDKASENLMIIAHDKGVDSNEFIQARIAAKAALSKFANFSQ